MRVKTHYPTSGTATVRDAMQFLGLGKTRLYELIDDEGKTPVIPSFREGRSRKFDWEDLWAYRAARKRSA